VSLSCHTVWWVQGWNGAARSLAGPYSGLPMAHPGGSAVVLEADLPFPIGPGQAGRPGGQVAGTCRPGSEGTRGRSIRADPSRRWAHRAPGPLRDMTAYRTDPISPRSGRKPTPVTGRAPCRDRRVQADRGGRIGGPRRASLPGSPPDGLRMCHAPDGIPRGGLDNAFPGREATRGAGSFGPSGAPGSALTSCGSPPGQRVVRAAPQGTSAATDEEEPGVGASQGTAGVLQRTGEGVGRSRSALRRE
jgi:hypothetical protein